MPLTQIHELPTHWEGGSKVHESIFRCYHLLQLARWLLANGTRGSVVLAILEDLEKP